MAEAAEHRVEVLLDELLAAREMTLVELSARVGVTVANLSILKNGHARAIRFSTLTAICDALDCTPGQLIRLQDWQPPSASTHHDHRAAYGTRATPP
jgi:putative transcriptional regulator